MYIFIIILPAQPYFTLEVQNLFPTFVHRTLRRMSNLTQNLLEQSTNSPFLPQQLDTKSSGTIYEFTLLPQQSSATNVHLLSLTAYM